jgi:hypothetical protein
VEQTPAVIMLTTAAQHIIAAQRARRFTPMLIKSSVMMANPPTKLLSMR